MHRSYNRLRVDSYKSQPSVGKVGLPDHNMYFLQKKETSITFKDDKTTTLSEWIHIKAESMTKGTLHFCHSEEKITMMMSKFILDSDWEEKQRPFTKTVYTCMKFETISIKKKEIKFIKVKMWNPEQR